MTKTTPFEEGLLVKVPPVSLLKWYSVLSPISDEDQTTVIPHRLYSILTIFMSAIGSSKK